MIVSRGLQKPSDREGIFLIFKLAELIRCNQFESVKCLKINDPAFPVPYGEGCFFEKPWGLVLWPHVVVDLPWMQPKPRETTGPDPVTPWLAGYPVADPVAD